MKDKKQVGKLFNLLTTAYGLAVSEDDRDVELCDIDTLLGQNKREDGHEKREIDKDVC